MQTGHVQDGVRLVRHVCRIYQVVVSRNKDEGKDKELTVVSGEYLEVL